MILTTLQQLQLPPFYPTPSSHLILIFLKEIHNSPVLHSSFPIFPVPLVPNSLIRSKILELTPTCELFLFNFCANFSDQFNFDEHVQMHLAGIVPQNDLQHQVMQICAQVFESMDFSQGQRTHRFEIVNAFHRIKTPSE